MKHVASSWRHYYRCFDLGVLLILWLFNEAVLKPEYDWARWYFNDLLAMPMLLSWSSLLFILRGKEMPEEYPVFLFVMCSVTWEIIFPFWVGRGTSDPLDVMMYTFGTLFWILFLKEMTIWPCITGYIPAPVKRIFTEPASKA
jgi:hypothetical protein